MTRQLDDNAASGRRMIRRLGAGATVAAAATGGALKAWGLDNDGQVGDGTQSTGAVLPVDVKLPAGVKVTQARAGCFFTVALTSTGKVLAWGDNSSGQLGDGTSNDESQPKLILLPGGATVSALSAGNFHSLALTTKGKVFAWGEGTEGELGVGGTTDIFSAVKVHMPKTFAVTGIAAGPGADHSLAIGHKV